MLNKTLKAILSVILAVAMCFVTCTAAFAATSNKKSYIKEVFLSYGETDNDAKSYLKDNGYEVLIITLTKVQMILSQMKEPFISAIKQPQMPMKL